MIHTALRSSLRMCTAASLASLLLLAEDVTAAEKLFDLREIPSRGRSVAAELLDANGDGLTDLVVVVLDGIPPEETRVANVYLQREGLVFPEEVDHSVPIPAWTAVYDVADLAEAPGQELVLLRPDVVTVLSLATPEGQRWNLPVPGPTTLAVAADERGLEPFKLVYDDFGPEPWILVPQFGQLSALAADGTVLAELAISRRANYFVIPPVGLISLESEIQVFADFPKLAVGDVDGDGRVDITTATRHQLQVFQRDEAGGFPREPTRTLPLRRVTPRDHIRGSGGVVSEIADFDADGLLDLLITHTSGGFTDAVSTTTSHPNRGGWNVLESASELVSDAAVGSDVVVDLDNDGLAELLRVQIEFSLLEVVELLLTQEVDCVISIHRYDPEQGFLPEPYVRRKLSAPFSFETSRLRGFIPTLAADLNADGYRDFVTSGAGDELEVFLGAADSPFKKSAGSQELNTAGVIHFTDIDDDGLSDFVLFDPHNFDVPIRIGRNLGALPGSPLVLRADEKPGSD